MTVGIQLRWHIHKCLIPARARHKTKRQAVVHNLT